jgi:hypothetical protein
MAMITISKQTISNMTSEDITLLANRLEKDEYSNPFEGLRDWHLLRAIAFQRPEMVDIVQPYLYLLDMEAYDEA